MVHKRKPTLQDELSYANNHCEQSLGLRQPTCVILITCCIPVTHLRSLGEREFTTGVHPIPVLNDGTNLISSTFAFIQATKFQRRRRIIYCWQLVQYQGAPMKSFGWMGDNLVIDHIDIFKELGVPHSEGVALATGRSQDYKTC